MLELLLNIKHHLKYWGLNCTTNVLHPNDKVTAIFSRFSSLSNTKVLNNNKIVINCVISCSDT
jgi:hypothetical protein